MRAGKVYGLARRPGTPRCRQKGEKKLKKAVCIAVLIALTGCATSSKNIASAYVSPVTYANYDCQQLIAEASRIQGRVAQLSGRLDEAASNDAAIMGVGMVLFWPALFALGGTKAQEAEYANLKGHADAVQQALIEKKCAMQQPVPANATQTQQNPVAKN